MKDQLDNLIDDIESKDARLRRTRSNHTFSLDSYNTHQLMNYCKENSVGASAVLDRLISNFLDRLRERGAYRDKQVSEEDRVLMAQGRGKRRA